MSRSSNGISLTTPFLSREDYKEEDGLKREPRNRTRVQFEPPQKTRASCLFFFLRPACCRCFATLRGLYPAACGLGWLRVSFPLRLWPPSLEKLAWYILVRRRCTTDLTCLLSGSVRDLCDGRIAKLKHPGRLIHRLCSLARRPTPATCIARRANLQSLTHVAASNNMLDFCSDLILPSFPRRWLTFGCPTLSTAVLAVCPTYCVNYSKERGG